MLREAPLSDDFERLPRVQRPPPFVVSLILQAYMNNSFPEGRTDWPATP
jgi:hypothetical protein